MRHTDGNRCHLRYFSDVLISLHDSFDPGHWELGLDLDGRSAATAWCGPCRYGCGPLCGLCSTSQTSGFRHMLALDRHGLFLVIGVVWHAGLLWVVVCCSTVVESRLRRLELLEV